MEHKLLNDNKVTNSLGLSNGLIGKSKKKGMDLSRKSIEKILNFYTDLNEVWLLTGSGEMIKTESSLVNEKKTEYEKPCSNCKKLAGQIEELRNIISQQNKTIADLNREIGKLSSNNELSN